MANDFAMVYRGIFDGSFHDAPPYAKLVFIAMMMDAAPDGTVRFFPDVWAPRIPCTADEAREALEILKSPDPLDSSGENEGRRILDRGGNLYEIVNYAAYRQHRTAAERREYMRIKKQESRERIAQKQASLPAPGKPAKKSTTEFVPPTLLEAKAYFAEKGRSSAEAQAFWEHFENCHWKLSSGRGALMKDWKLAANNWGSGRFVNGQAAPGQAAPVYRDYAEIQDGEAR